MAMLRNDFTTSLLNQGVEIFWDAYDATPDVWTGLFEQKNIDGPYIESTSMVGMGDLLEKKEGEELSYDQPGDGWPTLGSVRTFGRKIAWSMELYEDNKIEGLFQDLVRSWGEAYSRTRDRYFARFFNEGALLTGSDIFDQSIPGVKVDPTGGFVYDGKPFFADTSNAHPAKM